MSSKGSITTNDEKEDKRQEFLQAIFTDFTKAPVAFKSPAVVYNFSRHRLGVPNVSFKETFKTLAPYTVDNHNTTANKALPYNLSPAEITPANNGYIHNILRGDQKRLEQHTRKFIKPFRLKIGDLVRYTTEEHAFYKGYRGSFTEEVFEVRKRFRRAPQYDINLYFLKDLVGESIEEFFWAKSSYNE